MHLMHDVYAHHPPSVRDALDMATPEVTSSAPPQDEALFRQLDEYPWDADAEFQGGLRAILGPDPDPERAKQLTLRARCFYYSRHEPPQHSINIITDKKPGNATFQLTSRPTELGIPNTHPDLLSVVVLFPALPLLPNRPSSRLFPKHHQPKPTPTPPPHSRTSAVPFPMAPHPLPPLYQHHHRHQPPPILLPSAK